MHCGSGFRLPEVGLRGSQRAADTSAVYSASRVPNLCDTQRSMRSKWSAASTFESLSSVRARRKDSASREREVLRVSGSIPTTAPSLVAAEVREECLKWVSNRAGDSIPEQAWHGHGFEHFRGGRNAIGVRLEHHPYDMWAVRTDDPDKEVPGRTWSTETLVATLGEDAVAYAIRLLVNTSESHLDIEPHVPGQVRQVADRFTLTRGLVRFSSSPTHIDTDGKLNELVRTLEAPERDVPIVLVSARPSEHLYLDVESLARTTVGVAQVAVIEDAQSWRLTALLGKRYSVYGGAARVYLPGFSRASNPFAHRLFLPDALREAGGAREALRWIRVQVGGSSVLNTRLNEDLFSFEQVRNLSLRLRREQLAEASADTSEQLVLAEQQIVSLEQQVGARSEMLDYFAEQYDLERERAEAAEELANSSAFRIQQLLDHIRESNQPTPSQPPSPTQWEDFAEWCRRAWPVAWSLRTQQGGMCARPSSWMSL